MQNKAPITKEQIQRYLSNGAQSKIARKLGLERSAVTRALEGLDPANEAVQLAADIVLKSIETEKKLQQIAEHINKAA